MQPTYCKIRSFAMALWSATETVRLDLQADGGPVHAWRKWALLKVSGATGPFAILASKILFLPIRSCKLADYKDEMTSKRQPAASHLDKAHTTT